MVVPIAMEGTYVHGVAPLRGIASDAAARWPGTASALCECYSALTGCRSLVLFSIAIVATPIVVGAVGVVPRVCRVQ
jgi:hypothetical protein